LTGDAPLVGLHTLSKNDVAELCAAFNGRAFTEEELRAAARLKHGPGAYSGKGLAKLRSWGYLKLDVRSKTYTMVETYEPNITRVTID
jgi:hypothetical protein